MCVCFNTEPPPFVSQAAKRETEETLRAEVCTLLYCIHERFVCCVCVCVCIQLSSREREVSELREEVREGEEKREEGERQRDDIITNLQEKVRTTHAYTFYTHTWMHTHRYLRWRMSYRSNLRH